MAQGCHDCFYKETCTKMIRVAPKTVVHLTGSFCQAWKSRTLDQLIQDYVDDRKQFHKEKGKKANYVNFGRELHLSELAMTIAIRGGQVPPMEEEVKDEEGTCACASELSEGHVQGKVEGQDKTKDISSEVLEDQKEHAQTSDTRPENV